MNEQLTNAYQVAKYAAHLIVKHPGATARALYQECLPQFAEFGTDGSNGSTMILQHLRKLEEEGKVVSEKGKIRGNPAKWWWVGAEDDAPVVPALDVMLELPTDDVSQDDEPEDESQQPDDEPVAATQAEDAWDALARSFAQACREQAGSIRCIDNSSAKLAALERLIPLVAEDLADVLRQIAEDITNITGENQ